MSKHDDSTDNKNPSSELNQREQILKEKIKYINECYRNFVSEAMLQQMQNISALFSVGLIETLAGFTELVDSLQNLNQKFDQERAKKINQSVAALQQRFDTAAKGFNLFFDQVKNQKFTPEEPIRANYLQQLYSQQEISYLFEKLIKNNAVDKFLLSLDQEARKGIQDSNEVHEFMQKLTLFNNWLKAEKLVNFELKAPLEVILPVAPEAKEPTAGESILEAKYNARSSVNAVVHKIQQLNANSHHEADSFVIEAEAGEEPSLVEYLSNRTAESTETAEAAPAPLTLRDAVLARLSQTALTPFAEHEAESAEESQEEEDAYLKPFITKSDKGSVAASNEVPANYKFYNLVFVDKKHSGGQINIREDYFYDFVKGTLEEGLLYKINIISYDEATANGAELFADRDSISGVFNAVKNIAAKLEARIQQEQEIATQRSPANAGIQAGSSLASTENKQVESEVNAGLESEQNQDAEASEPENQDDLADQLIYCLEDEDDEEYDEDDCESLDDPYSCLSETLAEGLIPIEEKEESQPQEESNITPETAKELLRASEQQALVENRFVQEDRQLNERIVQKIKDRLDPDNIAISEQELQELKEALEDPYALKKDVDRFLAQRKQAETESPAPAIAEQDGLSHSAPAERERKTPPNLNSLSLHTPYNLNAYRGSYHSQISTSVAETTLTSEDLERLEQEITALPKPTRNLVIFFMNGGRMREFDKLSNLLKESISFDLHKLLFKRIETRQLNEAAKNKEREFSVYVLENRYFATDDFKIEGFHEFYKLAKVDNYHQIFAPKTPKTRDPRVNASTTADNANNNAIPEEKISAKLSPEQDQILRAKIAQNSATLASLLKIKPADPSPVQTAVVNSEIPEAVNSADTPEAVTSADTLAAISKISLAPEIDPTAETDSTSESTLTAETSLGSEPSQGSDASPVSENSSETLSEDSVQIESEGSSSPAEISEPVLASDSAEAGEVVEATETVAVAEVSGAEEQPAKKSKKTKKEKPKPKPRTFNSQEDLEVLDKKVVAGFATGSEFTANKTLSIFDRIPNTQVLAKSLGVEAEAEVLDPSLHELKTRAKDSESALGSVVETEDNQKSEAKAKTKPKAKSEVKSKDKTASDSKVLVKTEVKPNSQSKVKSKAKATETETKPTDTSTPAKTEETKPVSTSVKAKAKKAATTQEVTEGADKSAPTVTTADPSSLVSIIGSSEKKASAPRSKKAVTASDNPEQKTADAKIKKSLAPKAKKDASDLETEKKPKSSKVKTKKSEVQDSASEQAETSESKVSASKTSKVKVAKSDSPKSKTVEAKTTKAKTAKVKKTAKSATTQEKSGKKIKLAEVKHLLAFLQKQEANFSKSFPQLASDLQSLSQVAGDQAEQIKQVASSVLTLSKKLLVSLQARVKAYQQKLAELKTSFSSAKQAKDKEQQLKIKSQANQLQSKAKKCQTIVNKLIALAPALAVAAKKA